MVAALAVLPGAQLVLGDRAHQVAPPRRRRTGDVVELDAGVLDHVVQVRRADQVLGRPARREQRGDGDRVQDVRLVAALSLLPAVCALREAQRGSCPLRVDHEAQLTQGFQA